MNNKSTIRVFKMIRLGNILFITIICLFFISQSAFAEKLYITDFFKVTLRTGPSLQNKILAMLSSGQPVETLRSDGDWTQVQILRKGEKLKGWVLNRYLISRVPWKLQVKRLSKENSRLKEKLDRIENELNKTATTAKDTSQKLKINNKDLNKLRREHELLKKGAANYLQLKTNFEKTTSTLEAAQASAQKLTLENERLRYSRRNTWFITGASVLFLGFVVGMFMGKRQKKQKSMYYS